MATAARYLPRSPRYIFRPQDERLLRFAGIAKKSQAIQAEIRNLSTTGISFAVSQSAAPVTGQMLKVEFELPGREQVAWFATVVRLETATDWHPRNGEKESVLVALQFHKIPESVVAVISRQLRPHLQVQQEIIYDLNQVEAKSAAVFLFLCGALALVYSAVAISIHTWIGMLLG